MKLINNIIVLYQVIFFLAISTIAKSQCATLTVNPSGPINTPCDTIGGNTPNYNLQGNINFNFTINETNTYTTQQIPFAPLPWIGTNAIPTNIDDCWSAPVQLPFKFCYFGQTYTQFVIGSNGQVSFDVVNTQPPLQAGSNDWTIQTPAPNNVTEFNNCILACYSDLNPFVNGSITWQVFGVAPCRSMVINFTSIPLFSCPFSAPVAAADLDSIQVVLHELTNIIDINIARKTSCLGANLDIAHQGIQNANGTVALMTPGRNGTTWTTNNDSRSFIPSGNPYNLTTIYNWYNANSNLFLGTGTNYNVTYPYPDSIKCIASIIGGCNNDTSEASKIIEFTKGKMVADFNYNLRIGCTEDSVDFTNNTVPSINSTYLWDFGDLTTSTLENPTHIYANQGTFTVTLITNHPPCIPDTIQKVVTINHSTAGFVNADFNFNLHLGCVDDTVHFTNTSTTNNGGPITSIWDWGNGMSSNFSNNPLPVVYQTQSPNPYLVTLIIDDKGCKDTVQKSFTLYHPINAQFFANSGADIDSACLGSLMNFDASNSTPAGGFLNYFWDFGNGVTINKNFNGSLFTYTYPQSGNFLAQLIVTDSLGCTDTAKHNIYIEPTPYNNFEISDNQICIGQPVYFADTMDAHQINFSWNFDDGGVLANVHNPSHTFVSSGLYNVSLTTNYQICPAITTTKNISVEDFPSVNLGADTSICPGLTGTILLANSTVTSGSYLWNTGETTNSILVNTPGYYWLKTTSPTGECSTTDTLQVLQDCYLNIPNSFSPNGDGLNDYFLPREILSSGLTVFRMSIYNRWGEKIYATDKLNGRGWDGKYNDKTQPVGVFIYVIDAVFENGVRKNFTGNVTLLK
jgi:gliding motility-associated-like protein